MELYLGSVINGPVAEVSWDSRLRLFIKSWPRTLGATFVKLGFTMEEDSGLLVVEEDSVDSVGFAVTNSV